MLVGFLISSGYKHYYRPFLFGARPRPTPTPPFPLVDRVFRCLLQLVSFNSNPFSWDESAESVTSSVLDFELKGANGARFNVSGLTEEIEITLTPGRRVTQPDVSTNFVKPSLNGSGSNMRYHRISIPGKEYAVFIRVIPPEDVGLEVYVRYNERPTLTEYNVTASVPDFSSCRNGTTNCSADPYVVTVSSATTGHAGLHYVGIRFQQPAKPAISPRQRKRRDCLFGRRKKRSCVGVKDPPTTMPPTKIIVPPYNATSDVNYTMMVSMATCLFWNITAQQWSSSGCRVGELLWRSQ